MRALEIGVGTLSAVLPEDLPAFMIDQAEADGRGRPAQARRLSDGLGRVGGAQVDLLQDRRPAIGSGAEELETVRGARGL